MREAAHDGAYVDMNLHVAFEVQDCWVCWFVNIVIGTVKDWTKPDVILQPTALITLSEKELRWMIQRLQGLLDHITTHDCGEMAELKREEEARSTTLPIGGHS
jgi:hypothetical protein